MLISPPFLPERAADQTEEQWLAAAMCQPPSCLPGTRSPEGSFPLSHNLAWHNGLHLQAPRADGADLTVRAIADGTVVFARAPTARDGRADHAQNYDPFGGGCARGSWTDNGCVVVRHRTSIGSQPVVDAHGNQSELDTEFVFFSVYMHLSALGTTTPRGQTQAREWRADDPIWRKDEVGRPGRIYGHDGQIHFEICLDDANLETLVGRRPAWVDPTAMPPAPDRDGRIDSLYGHLYVYLPATTATDAGRQMPADHLRPVAPRSALGQAIWVRMTYDRGRCTFQTLDLRGNPIGQPRTDAEGEYQLYDQATARHAALPDATRARSSPSGWYELLRFGRNIGRGPAAADKDPLPENVAHWRRIVGPDGREVWADLNAAGSFKFSDADFPAVAGWNFVDDDASPDDQRCDSESIKRLIRDPNPGNARRMDHEQLVRRLGDAGVRQTLRRLFCRFPSEWDRATIAARYGFVRELPRFRADPQAWPRLEAHLRAMTFDRLPQEYLEARWRGHPVELIARLGTCGWLSADDLRRILRRAPAVAPGRISPLMTAVNTIMRKYGISERQLRMTHFLAQTSQETAWWLYRRESGNERYFRTMYEVITSEEAADDFTSGRAANLGLVRVGDTDVIYSARRPREVESKAIGLGNGEVSRATGGQVGDGARFRGRGLIQVTGRLNYRAYGAYRRQDYESGDNCLLVESVDYNLVDTAGYYWIRERINAECDAGSDDRNIDRVGGIVNRGRADRLPMHAVDRRSSFRLIWQGV